MDDHSSVQVLVFVVGALLIGAITRFLQKDSRIPYTVALILIGIGIGLLETKGWISAISHEAGGSLSLVANIDPHLLLFLFLPTLVFESASALEVHLFKRMFSQIALLAVPGLLVSTFTTAAFVHFLIGWDWPIALIFGALISATDPVAVVALLKEVSSRKRLETLIEGESLFNDGTAIVLFTLFMALVASTNTNMNLWQAGLDFAWVVSMGLVVGMITGGFVLSWIKRVFNDPLIEITLTIVSAYLVFYIAENLLHVSGVVAVVSLALLFASIGRTRISPEVGGFLHHFWELLAYMANTLIFLIVGILIALRLELDNIDMWINLGIIYIAVMLIRGFSISLFMPILSRIGIGITRDKAIVLWWGGLRGAVSLALGLIVATSPLFPTEMQQHILFYTAGIVVMTIVINGSSMGWLLGKLGMDRLPTGKQVTVDRARSIIATDLNQFLPTLKKESFLDGADWEKVNLNTPLHAPEIKDDVEEEAIEVAYFRRLLETERQHYWTLFKNGSLGTNATQILVDAVERALDGTPVLYPRQRLESIWQTPWWLSSLQKVPFLRGLANKMAYTRFVTTYDVARGFVLAQEEIATHVDKLAPAPEFSEKAFLAIGKNKQESSEKIEHLKTIFPEVIQSLETACALRAMMNRERTIIKKLLDAAVLAHPEAQRLTDDVERRMHQLRRTPPSFPDSKYLLSQAAWCQGFSDSLLEKLASMAEQRVFNPGDVLIQEGKKATGLIFLVCGQVKQSSRLPGNDGLTPQEGDLIGVEGLLMQTQTETVTAVTPADALWFNAKPFSHVLAEYPELFGRLSQILQEHIQQRSHG